jgi:hypothetical protein
VNTRPLTPRAALAALARPILVLLLAAAAAGAPPLDGATALDDTIQLAVVATPSTAQAGDVIVVALRVPTQGPAFNAYDAYLDYDPDVLQFLPAADLSTQEGPLMTAACGTRFHVFQADTLAGRLRVSHSLICDRDSIVGPGVVYQVRFRCRNVDADTPLALLRAAPHRTAFYQDGREVLPLATTDATVRVGAGSTSAAETPRVGVTDLRVAPNPFNPRTTVSLTAVRDGALTVDIVTVDGRRVRRLWDAAVAAGTWHVDWDGRDDRGRDVAAGVYLVAARSAGAPACVRVALVR